MLLLLVVVLLAVNVAVWGLLLAADTFGYIRIPIPAPARPVVERIFRH